MKHAYEIPDQAHQGHEPPGDEKYGPKEVRKGVQNPHPITQNPVKHVSHETREGQKEVKSGPKNAQQNAPQTDGEYSVKISPKIDEKHSKR
jgi:hypothetical protein